MAKILSTDMLDARLDAYYQTNFGKRDSDVFWKKPAENVWLFEREGRYVVLQCHIITGEVTASFADE